MSTPIRQWLKTATSYHDDTRLRLRTRRGVCGTVLRRPAARSLSGRILAVLALRVCLALLPLSSLCIVRARSGRFCPRLTLQSRHGGVAIRVNFTCTIAHSLPRCRRASSSSPQPPDSIAFTEGHTLPNPRQCSSRWILQKYPIAPWHHGCYTGFPGHPECDGYMSQELQGNHTQTGTSPHNGLRRAVALAPCWRVVCVSRAWPPLANRGAGSGKVAQWMGGWVGVCGHRSGGVPDCRLVPYRAVFLCFLGCRPSVVLLCCLGVPHPSTVLPTTAVQDARLAASCRWDCSRIL